MKTVLFQTMCFMFGGLLFFGAVKYVPVANLISKTLEAAIGSLSFDSIRTWQRQGGFTRTLYSGAQGDDVVLLQSALATDVAIYPEGLITGLFGLATKNAVNRFQAMYNLPVTGKVDAATRHTLNDIFFGQLCPSATTTTETNFWLSHVSRDHGLPSDYIPPNLINIEGLVRTEGIMCVTEATAEALQNMFAAAAQDGMLLSVCSGYRGPGMQGLLYQQYVTTEGSKAFGEIALPYHSEHQLGTAVDLTGATNACTADDFGASPVSQWLVENAWKFGFNLSYPAVPGNGAQAEYVYEPWHWRYVGRPLAAQLHQLNLSYNEIDPLQAALFSLITATTTRAVQ